VTVTKPAFCIGDLVQHSKFGYRGVVVDVDPVFEGTEDWYDMMARSRPPKDRPWYHVLVDGATHMTYVAERHLQADGAHTQIDHPALGRFFDCFVQGRYLLRDRHR